MKRFLFLLLFFLAFAEELHKISINGKIYYYKTVTATEIYNGTSYTRKIIICCGRQFKNIEDLRKNANLEFKKPIPNPIQSYLFVHDFGKTLKYLNIDSCQKLKTLSKENQCEALITLLINDRFKKADTLLNCSKEWCPHSLYEPYMSVIQGKYKKIDSLLKKHGIKMSGYVKCFIAKKRQWKRFEYFTSAKEFYLENPTCSEGLKNVISKYGYKPLSKKTLEKLSAEKLRALSRYDKRDYLKALICVKELKFYNGDKNCKYALKYFPKNIKVLIANKKIDQAIKLISSNAESSWQYALLFNLYILKHEKNKAKTAYLNLLKKLYKRESSLKSRMIVNILGPFMGIKYPKTEKDLKKHVVNLALYGYRGINFYEKFVSRFNPNYDKKLKKETIKEANGLFFKN